VDGDAVLERRLRVPLRRLDSRGGVLFRAGNEAAERVGKVVQ
jgi:hypothetical protein